ncbi:MAG: Hint domain-containing homing endonuclease [Candidatus Colwellbacteria bacterium]|nr:Hint domain-containing homing endonuclease [Candidatus Colwellbacteria bacterium]
MPPSRSRDDDDVVDNYYDLDDKDSRTVGIKELDLNTLYPQHPLDYKNGSKYCIIGKPGCHKRGTKIILFNGETKNVEDIQLDDVLMGDDSTPRHVLGLARGREEMYDIIPTKGDKYTVNKSHILTLKSSGFANHPKGEVIDISVNELLNKQQIWRTRFKGFKVSIEFEEKKLDIHPYLMGYWLGDGTSNNAEITTADHEIVTNFDSLLYEYGLKLSKSGCSPYRYGITLIHQKNRKGKNQFMNCLRDNNLVNNKHITHQYKCNSRQNRLELLAGLLDSDGSYNVKSKCYDFIQKSEKLFDDVLFLARSLGFACYKQPCKKSCMYKGEKREGNYFRCVISGDIDQIPCRVERKKASPRTQIKDVLVTGLKMVSVGIDDYYGFELDGNNRYLMEDFTVTHNTGKSTIIKSILYAKKHIFSVGAFWSGTEDSNGFFKSFTPTTFIRDGMIDASSAASLKPLEDLNKRQKIARKYLEPRGDNPWCVEVLDDCTADPKFLKKTVLKDTYKNGRHKAKMHLLSLQFCLDIPTDTRGLIDGTFICREGNSKNRLRLFENFGSGVDNIHDWNDLMDGLTDDYCCMFVNNKATTNNIEDCIQYYRADPDKIPKDWKFGCKDYWDFHYDRYNPNFVETF